MKCLTCLASVFFLLALAQPAFALEWYEGGTLQRGDAIEWVKATPADQLASSADFLAVLSAVSDIGAIRDPQEAEAFRQKAIDLKDCVNRTLAEDKTKAEAKVAELVIGCTLFKKAIEAGSAAKDITE